MALTAEQLATIRNEVGSTPVDADLQSIYDRVLGLYATAYEVVAQRLADLRANPASFTVSGEYSQNTAENIKSLERHLDKLARLKAAEAAGVEDPNAHTVTMTEPTMRWSR